MGQIEALDEGMFTQVGTGKRTTVRVLFPVGKKKPSTYQVFACENPSQVPGSFTDDKILGMCLTQRGVCVFVCAKKQRLMKGNWK